MIHKEDARQYVTERAAELGISLPSDLLQDVAALLDAMQESAFELAQQAGQFHDA